MVNDLRASWALLIGIGFMMLGNGLQGTLLGLRATLEGFPTFVTGVMMSGYFVGIFAGSILAPRLVQRVGHIRVFAALASLTSISILVQGLYIDPVIWTAMRFVTGLSYAGLYVVTESWLNDRATNETRGQVLSVYMLIVTLGLGGGQFLLNMGDPMTVQLFILVSIIASFGLIPILLTARPAPLFESAGAMSLKALYRATPLAVVSNGLTGVAHGTIFGLGAVYAAQELEGVRQVSYFMACILFGSLIFQWPMGWLADKINRRLIMGGLCLTSILCCILMLLVAKGSMLFFGLLALLGGASIPMYSLSVAYANDRLEPEQIVAASGSMVMIAGIGLSIGPVVVSWLMGEFGTHFFFIGIATAFFMILSFIIYRMSKTEAVSLDEQHPYVSAGVIGTPVASYNSPDADEFVDALIHNELHELDQKEGASPEKDAAV